MFTEEQIKKAKECRNEEELLSLAKESDVALSVEEAAEFFAELNKHGELADEELDNVAGGACDGPRTGKACGEFTKKCSKYEFDQTYYCNLATCGVCVFCDSNRNIGKYEGYCRYPERQPKGFS